MVKKLFKHEFLAYIRVMGIVYLILLAMATAGRIIWLFESDTIAFNIIGTFSNITYGISVAAAFGFMFVLGIVRFYKHLFTAEGYLSFTLPVTPTQHILVKVVTAVAMLVVTFVAVLLSGCIISAGELFVEICKAAAYLWRAVYTEVSYQGILMVIELIILLILWCVSGLMLYYVFISIGQLFKKNRILAAVGAYFVYYVATQILSTIFLVVLSILGAAGALDKLGEWLVYFIPVHPYIFIHSCVGIIALLTAVFIFVEFIVVKRIITKRLNLE